MKKSKDCWTPIQALKEEINFRDRIITYKKLYKQFLYRCFDKNNFKILQEIIPEILEEDK